MTGTDEDRKHWSEVAREWIAWARKPNHDAFWAYRESLVAFIGRSSGKALDVGCGEGRVSRELMALGYQVTAVDPVSELVEAASQVQSSHDYAVAGSPFSNRAGAFPHRRDLSSRIQCWAVREVIAQRTFLGEQGAKEVRGGRHP